MPMLIYTFVRKFGATVNSLARTAQSTATVSMPMTSYSFVSSYHAYKTIDCSYDQPSNRRRNPAPLFLEAMEKKLRRAESIMHLCFPGVSADDHRFDILLQQQNESHLSDISSLSARFNALDPGATTKVNTDPPELGLDSMVTSKGALNQNERGEYDYFGASSGFNFLRRMSEEFGEISRPRTQNDPSPTAMDPRTENSGMSSAMMVLPGQSRSDSFSENDSSFEDLPTKEKALTLIRFALDDACAILPCVHQPSFYAAVDRIYGLQPEHYTTRDHRFLPLLYVVIALGCLFAKDESSELERKGYTSATEEGYKYFWAARELIDVTDCRDLVSLQAIIFMILFLQCSAKLSTCYAFIGVALRSAIRMGMHRSFHEGFNPVESETRKRCFWIIRKMDIFVGALLGLPLTLSDHDIDQDFPAEVDDENITPHGIKPQAAGHIPLIAASNQDFTLTKIIQKLTKHVYPIKGPHSGGRSVYKVPLSAIKEIERDLQNWEDQLHPVFKPGSNDAPPKLLR
ncbi:MAG: hypothetical protein Q9162_006135 [Coniocarpon cinnabarinum]